MNLDYVFIAIMFPAIPLMMSVFSNRFHTLSVLIRSMHDEYKYKKQSPAKIKKQFMILESRVTLLRRAQLFMGVSFLFNMISVFLLFIKNEYLAKIFFALCLLSIIIALMIYLYEITLSSKALNYHLSDLEITRKKK